MKGYDIASIIASIATGTPIGTVIHGAGKMSEIFGLLKDSGVYNYGSNNDYMKKLEEMVASDRVWNSAEAQKNRDWQERMANTSVQRSVADIQQAGLNPWLAVQGSSALSGGSYSGAQADSSSSTAYAQLLASNMTNQNKFISTLINGLLDAVHSSLSVAQLAAAGA